MRYFNSRKSLYWILIVCFALFLVVLPEKAEAKWHKQSELPGMTDSEMITYGLMLIGAIVLIYYVNKSVKAEKKHLKNTEKNMPADSLLQSNLFQTKLNGYSTATHKTDVNVLPFIQLKTKTAIEANFKNDLNFFKNKTVMVGLSVKF